MVTWNCVKSQCCGKWRSWSGFYLSRCGGYSSRSLDRCRIVRLIRGRCSWENRPRIMRRSQCPLGRAGAHRGDHDARWHRSYCRDTSARIQLLAISSTACRRTPKSLTIVCIVAVALQELLPRPVSMVIGPQLLFCRFDKRNAKGSWLVI
jgi:hypothetical protein